MTRCAFSAIALIPVALAATTTACGAANNGNLMTPHIGVMPERVDVPATPVGMTQTANLQVENFGRTTLTIQSVGVSEGSSLTVPEATFFTTTCAGITRDSLARLQLKPGECANLGVQITPTTVGTVGGEVIIESNDVPRATIRVPIYTTGQ